MNDTERRHLEEVGRAAAALIILEGADGSDCQDRATVRQAVAQRMAEGVGTETYVFVRMVGDPDGPEMFEPFRIDEFQEEFEACISDWTGGVMVMAGVDALTDEFLLSPFSNRIH